MKQIILAVALTIASLSASWAGPCQHADDRDSRGNRCGDRAADKRPGGK